MIRAISVAVLAILSTPLEASELDAGELSRCYRQVLADYVQIDEDIRVQWSSGGHETDVPWKSAPDDLLVYFRKNAFNPNATLGEFETYSWKHLMSQSSSPLGKIADNILGFDPVVFRAYQLGPLKEKYRKEGKPEACSGL